MTGKTLKIASELHNLLKLKAVKESKTLQEVTEELINEGLKQQNQKSSQGNAQNTNSGGNKKRP